MTNRLSTWLTQRDATPSAAADPAESVGVVKEAVGFVASAADDASASIFRFLEVPSNARILDVLYTGADATTAGAIDVGIYKTTANGGAVVDADFFASAFALTAGPDTDTNLRDEGGFYTTAERAKPLWEALGLTSDPGVMYDVCATVTTTFNGGPTAMLLRVRYVE